MKQSGDILDHFIGKTIRLTRLARSIDHLAICIALAAAIMLMLLPLAMRLGIDRLEVLGACLAAALMAWAVLWFLQTPTALEISTRADEQLNLDDLFSSAITCPEAQPWAVSLRAQAVARCRSISPALLVRRRFGARAWGGAVSLLGLAVAGAVIPVQLHAFESADVSGTPTLAISSTSSQLMEQLQRADAGHSHPQDSRGSDDPQMQNAVVTEPLQSPKTEPGHGGQRSDARASAGTGAASSNVAQRTASNDGNAANAAESHAGGLTSGGGDRPVSPHDLGSDNRAAPTASFGSTSAKGAPEWKATGWPAARASAAISLAQGSIPPTARDLVRDYFMNDK